MNSKIEFEKWWDHTPLRHMIDQSMATQIWCAAWACATLGQLDRAKDEVHVEIRAKLLAMAVESFKERDHERARFYQDLSDERHIIWSK